MLWVSDNRIWFHISCKRDEEKKRSNKQQIENVVYSVTSYKTINARGITNATHTHTHINIIRKQCKIEYILFWFLPSPWVKNVMVTLILSSKASVSNGCSIGADFVNTTRFGMIWPSITFLSISSGRGCGCNIYNNNQILECVLF